MRSLPSVSVLVCFDWCPKVQHGAAAVIYGRAHTHCRTPGRARVQCKQIRPSNPNVTICDFFFFSVTPPPLQMGQRFLSFFSPPCLCFLSVLLQRSRLSHSPHPPASNPTLNPPCLAIQYLPMCLQKIGGGGRAGESESGMVKRDLVKEGK